MNNKNNHDKERLLSNPVHGDHGKDRQMEIIVNNNIIIYEYFMEIWNSFVNYINK